MPKAAKISMTILMQSCWQKQIEEHIWREIIIQNITKKHPNG